MTRILAFPPSAHGIFLVFLFFFFFDSSASRIENCTRTLEVWFSGECAKRSSRIESSTQMCWYLIYASNNHVSGMRFILFILKICIHHRQEYKCGICRTLFNFFCVRYPILFIAMTAMRGEWVYYYRRYMLIFVGHLKSCVSQAK